MHVCSLGWHVIKKCPPTEITESREFTKRNSVTGESLPQWTVDVAEMSVANLPLQFIGWILRGGSTPLIERCLEVPLHSEIRCRPYLQWFPHLRNTA
jgi:hypothetical protein